MGRAVYVIQSIGYEYNDEINYVPESGGGHAKVVYLDEVAAKKKLMELEIKEWRRQDIGRYGYGIDEIADNVEEFQKALEAMGVDSSDWWEAEIPETATDEQIKNLIRHSSIRFHEIVEVVAEDYPEIPDSDIEPTSDMLDVQESAESKPKKRGGIFDSVDAFTNPNVEPTVVPDDVSIEDIKAVVEETNDNFLEIKNEMKRLRDEARQKVKNFFIKGMNKVFEMYPEVKTVSWTQYTPYFNDGEECVFSAHVEDFYVNGFDNWGSRMYGLNIDEAAEQVLLREEMEYDWVREPEQSRSTRVYKNPESRSVKIYEAISSFLSQLDDDDYKTMFGDHAIVVVKKDEVIIEEYDHD
jgi:hypothetical protein